MNKLPYDIGWDAYFDGKLISENPYPYGELEECTQHMEWEDGWKSAAAYNEYEEDQYIGPEEE